MAKKAGTLAIALTANSTLFDRALVRAERRINSFAAAAKKDFTAIGAAMGAHYLIGAGKTMIDELDQIGKRSDVLGISTERYQMLSAAATHTGVAMGDVESAMIRMNNVLAKAAVGDQKAISSFNLLGLEVEKLRSMRPDELFDTIAIALNDIGDPAVRNAALLEVFGKSGQNLNNFLRDYIAYGEAAKANGSIITDEVIRASEALNDQLTDINLQLKAVIVNLGLIKKISDSIDLAQYAGGESFWKHLGAESVNYLGAVLTFGARRDLADQLGLRPSDEQTTGPVTQTDLAIAGAKRDQRLAKRAADRAAAAERQRIRDEELARRLAEANKPKLDKATKTIAARVPETVTLGDYSAAIVARNATGGPGGSPAVRTADGVQKLSGQTASLTTTVSEGFGKVLAAIPGGRSADGPGGSPAVMQIAAGVQKLVAQSTLQSTLQQDLKQYFTNGGTSTLVYS